MTDLSKKGTGQTVLDLGDTPRQAAGQFDEAAYRAELIAAGFSAEDATLVAAKTADARRESKPTRTDGFASVGSAVGANLPNIA